MGYALVPLQSGTNQNLTISLPVDGKTLRLQLNIVWNGIGGYWYMSIVDAVANTLLLDAVPLLPGQYPAANLLDQYAYMGIGSAVLVPIGNDPAASLPTFQNLGTDYQLVWADTYPQ